MKRFFAGVFLSAVIFVTAWPRAEAGSRKGHFQLGGGVGVAFNDPVRFDVQIGGDYFFWEDISIGMNIDFLIRNGVVFVFMPYGRYHFDIDSAPKWVPYVGAGLGPAVSDDGNGFLDIMVPNFGVNYELIADRLFLGTDMSVHIVTNFDNTDWDFRWLIAHALFRF
jgi:hypothetical protein